MGNRGMPCVGKRHLRLICRRPSWLRPEGPEIFVRCGYIASSDTRVQFLTRNPVSDRLGHLRRWTVTWRAREMSEKGVASSPIHVMEPSREAFQIKGRRANA